MNVFSPRRRHRRGKHTNRLIDAEADAATEAEEFAFLERVVIEEELRYAETRLGKVQTIVSHHECFDESHGESRRDEVSRFRLDARSVGANADEFLGHRERDLCVEIKTRRDAVQKPADIRAHAKQAQI